MSTSNVNQHKQFVFLFRRVRVERNGGAWCPRQQATHQPRDWLEIDLKTDHVITAVETQGKLVISIKLVNLKSR